MSLIEKTEQFEQLREIAGKYAGKFEEDIGTAKLSITNFYGNGKINCFIIFPGFTITILDIYINKQIESLVYEISKEDLCITYCMEGKLLQSFGMEGPPKIIEKNENIIFHSSQSLLNVISIPDETRVKALFININRKELKQDNQNSGIQLAEYLKELFDIMDSEFMISNLILPETPIYKYALELLDIVKLDSVSKLLARGLSLQIMALQIKQLQSSVIDLPKTIEFKSLDYDRFLKHLNEVSKSLSSKITIENFGIRSGISKNKLQAICKNNFGVTFKKLIKDLRLEKARFLIQNTDLSMSEICYDIGYTSRSFFSKEFREQFGLNPMDYKNEIISNGLSFELSYYISIRKPSIIKNINQQMKLLSEACETLGITGVLIYYDGVIFHIIEGTKNSVLNLFGKIIEGRRTEDFTILFRGLRKKSRFPNHQAIIADESIEDIANQSAHHFQSSVVNIINDLDQIYLSGDLLWKRIYSLLKTSKKLYS